MAGKCKTCMQEYKPLSLGECKRCYAYRRKRGRGRPFGQMDGRKVSATRGSDHPAWRGDDAHPVTKRARAQRRYRLDKCEKCGRPAMDRHHIDGDTGNNDRENILLLCRRCHMKGDGRLDIFISHSRSQLGPQPPKRCQNCGRLKKPMRRGRCHACNEYKRRNGRERPYIEDGRKEKSIITKG